MASIDSVLKSASGYAKSVVSFGLSLVVVILVVEIIFGHRGDDSIVTNVQTLIGAFTGEGVVGLISLLFFLSIYD